MIKLHVVQAEYGDCLILESVAGKNSTSILIDGGPYQTYQKYLKPTLEKLLPKSKLDLVVLSHIDNDHIIGLIDLLEDIKNRREKGEKKLIKICKLWHNSFNDLLQMRQNPVKLIKNSLQTVHVGSSEEQKKVDSSFNSVIMKGFRQGMDLTSLAKSLEISINPEFDKLVSIDDVPNCIKLNDIAFRILGPTRKNLERLRRDWKKWLDKKKSPQLMEFELMQIMDKSIPNLSSIMLLVESKTSKILLTGDGSGDDIVNILKKNDMLDKQGRFYVDVLKVPHHGSDRNVSPEFFNTVSANYYIISANGRDDNPSLNTLKWILESGDKKKNLKKIIFTNNTPNIEKIRKEYREQEYNYQCVFLEDKSDFFTLNLSSLH